MTKPFFPGVAPDLPDGRKHRRQIAGVVNNILLGRTNNVASVTLNPSATSTVFLNPSLSVHSVLLFSATTATAAAALSGLYVSAKTVGSFTLTHASNSSTTQTFDVVIIG